MLGALVSVFAALSFSLSNVTIRRSVTKAPVAYAAMATVMLGVPMFFIACVVTGQIFSVADLSLSSYALLSGAGLIHYVVGRYFNYAAIDAIGSARAAPINNLGLPYSVLIALIFLGEGVNLGMLVGIGLIMGAPAIMVERRQPVKAPVATTPTSEGATGGAPETFQLRQAEGYFYAILAAVSYGTSPVLIRAALEGQSDLALLGGGISYVAAAVILLASLAIPARRPMVRALEPATLRIFAPSAFFVFFAQLLRFLALSLASVAMVTTLMRFGTIFTLVLSWVMNRDIEKITLRVIIGVVISLLGAVLLVVAS